MIAILAILFFCLPSASSAAEPCDLYSILNELTLNPHVTLREGEKSAYGTILKKGEKIPPLKENGTYVFLIDKDENIVISHRYPDLDEVSPVVTHRSLLNHLRKSSRQEPRIVAMGEINFDHGQISSINNKAGTAYMSNEALPVVARVLKARGLPIQKDTPLLLFNQVHKGHDAEHVAAAFRIKTLKDPRLNSINQKLSAFRASAQKRYPSKQPGMVDWDAFMNSNAEVANGLTVGTLSKSQFRFVPAFKWLESYEDRYRVIPIMKEGLTYEELEALVDDLPKMEGLFSR